MDRRWPRWAEVLQPALVVTLRLWSGSRRRLITALAAQVDHLRRDRGLRADQARLERQLLERQRLETQWLEAQQLEAQWLEAQWREAQRQARLDERARIAAEMHDALAHRLTLLALHAGALQCRAAELPEPVAHRIGLLRTAATGALGDLRDALGSLRCPDPTEPNRQQAPGLRELSALIDEARAAGQQIETVIEGEAGAVPADHRVAVHRLVREALTNARKHAAGAAVQVAVCYGPLESAAEIRNTATTAPADPPAAGGLGLTGLAERVTALGGRLVHGPTVSGGWRIAARIPIADRVASGTA